MKTKGVTVCMGLLLLASWVLLVPNVSFSFGGDRDNDSFWTPLMQANNDKDKDWGRSDPTPNQFNPSLQPPRHIRSYDGRDRDRSQDRDQDRGHHYGWGNGNHHHRPSACR